MCAVCGCLKTGSPAPEEGTYKCVECEEAGKAYQANVKKGESMPDCPTCSDKKGHWIKV
jgi:hypothetical protein